MRLRPLFAFRRGLDLPARLAAETLGEIMHIVVEDQPCLLSSVMMRQCLAGVCPWWTFVLYTSLHPWRKIVVTRFFDPSFVEACIGITSGLALDLFIDAKDFRRVSIARNSTAVVHSMPFDDFMRRTVPLLAAALQRTRKIHVVADTVHDLHAIAAVLCTVHAPNLVRAAFGADRDEETVEIASTVHPTVWSNVNTVIVQGGSPAVAAFPNTTHLYLGGSDGPLEVSWPRLREVLRSTLFLSHLRLGKFVYSHITDAGEVLLPHLTHLRVDLWDEDWLEFMAYINPPLLRVFHVMMTGMWANGGALWINCHPNLLGNVHELELGASSYGGEDFSVLLPQLRQLRKLNVLRCDQGVSERFVQALQTSALPSLREIRFDAVLKSSAASGILHQVQHGHLAENCRVISRASESRATWVEHSSVGGTLKMLALRSPAWKTSAHWSDGWEEDNHVSADSLALSPLRL